MEREGRGGGVQQSSETILESASGGGQDGVDVYGLVDSGKPKGERRCSSHTTVALTATSQGESLGRPGRWGFGSCGRCREGASRSIQPPQGRLGVHLRPL